MIVRIFLSFIVLVISVHRTEQQLSIPTNILDPLKISNPIVANVLNEYIINNQTKTDPNKTWAVLVAGSQGWYNYRHQADVLHLYQVLISLLKIPKEKIVLMVKDDLANSSINPHKGVIINEPNGENLYHDLTKDFTGDEVTSDNFLKILKGDKELAAKGKKVLDAKSDEDVLVYYSDHGSPGFLNFPDGILSATALNDVLEDLANRGGFRKMVVAIEACYSGSLFDQNLLKPNLSIYAMTAANGREQSYAEFLDSSINIYLADLFSHNFIYSLISCEKSGSTLADQYEIIKNETKDSHVQQFGDLKLARTTKLDDFLYPVDPNHLEEKCVNKNALDRIEASERLPTPSKDVKLTILERLKKQNKLTEHHLKILERIKKARTYLKEHVFKLGRSIAKTLNLDFNRLAENDNDDGIKDRKCYEHLVQLYHRNCYKINEHTYLGEYMHFFYKACNSLIDKQDKETKTKELENLILSHCKESNLEKFEPVE